MSSHSRRSEYSAFDFVAAAHQDLADESGCEQPVADHAGDRIEARRQLGRIRRLGCDQIGEHAAVWARGRPAAHPRARESAERRREAEGQ